ncbi:unnamed protein product [Parascedosporium putredinis]|uniref:Uncharacterized protein n=1 Tax=Parascedosporium putredinis TaxID=1442378 RepID=A0A9P1MEP7_9PEZI|nr:unnamed protein product [Parascedosporium putredinis]CAI8004991.1 unnamed protein product [Parascedosporium putredinis]
MQQFLENILVAYGVPILSALGSEYFVAIPLAFIAHWWDWPGLESTLFYLAVVWSAYYAPSIRADRPHDPEAFASLMRASRPKAFYVAISLTLRGLDWLGLAKYTTFTACLTALSTTALAYAASRFIERRAGFSIWRGAVRGITNLWGRSVDVRYRLFVGSMAAEVRLMDATQHLLNRFWPRAVTKLYMRLLGVDIDKQWTYQPLADPHKHIRLFRLARWVPFAGVRGSVIHVPLGGGSSNGATSPPSTRPSPTTGAPYAKSAGSRSTAPASPSPSPPTTPSPPSPPLGPLAPFTHQILHELLLLAANRANHPFLQLGTPSLHAKYELEVLGAPGRPSSLFSTPTGSPACGSRKRSPSRPPSSCATPATPTSGRPSPTRCRRRFAPEMAALLQLTQRGRRAVEQLSKLSTLNQTRRLMPLVRIHRTMNTGLSFALAQAFARIRAREGGVVETEEERKRNEALRRDPAPLIHLLHRFSHFDATDPRDKIYALQGLLAQDCPASLIPDYDAVTTPELFRRAAKHILSNRDMDERLALFAMTGFGSPGRDDALLPSWVPDLRRAHPRPRAFPMTTNPTANDLVYLPRWHASTLALAARHASDPYPFTTPGQTLREAFWRTLVGDADKDSRPAPAYLADVYADAVALWEEMLPYGLDEGRTMTLPDDEEHWARQKRAGVWSNAMAYCVTGRSLCATAAGYLGCVPRWARAGTRSSWCAGPAPLVVRSAEASDNSGNKNGGGPGAGRPVRYRILGQCYVHGIMDGEAVGSDPAWQAMEFV